MQRPRPLITISRPLLQRLSALMAVLAFVAASVFGFRLVRGSGIGARILAALPKTSPAAPEAGLRGASTGGASSEDIEASNSPVIRVEKALLSSGAVQVGDELAYRITVTNPSDIPLADIRLSDQYDTAHLQFLSADPAPGTVDEGSGLLSWDSLEAGLDDRSLDQGESLDLELRFVALAATDEAAAVNKASVEANGGTVTHGPVSVEVPIDAPAAAPPPESSPAALCLGDQVFVDLADDGRFDAAAGDLGISGVSLSLYGDSDGDGAWSDADPLLRQTQTDGDGRYGFCDLPEGDYLVVIDSANFALGGPLSGLRASAVIGEAVDPDDDVDGDNNGGSPPGASSLAVDLAAVASRAISLRAGAEPDTAIDGGDGNHNGTLDFGFAMRAGIGTGAPDPLPVAPAEQPAPEQPIYLGKPEQPSPWYPHTEHGKPVYGKPVHERPHEGGGRRP